MTILKYRENSNAEKRAFSEAKADWKRMILPGGRIMDIGAHIGLFLYNALTRENVESKSLKFTCVEPSPSSFELLKENIDIMKANFGKRLSLAKPIQAAVVGDTVAVKEVQLYERAGSETSNTIFPTRGREAVNVPAIGISNLLKKYKPTSVKVDIEGGEYDIMSSVLRDINIQEVGVEYHRIMQPKYRSLALELHDLAIQQGFSVIRMPVLDKKYWNTVAVYRR